MVSIQRCFIDGGSRLSRTSLPSSHLARVGGKREEYQTRIEELYTEIGRLSTQLSWLKKQGIDVD